MQIAVFKKKKILALFHSQIGLVLNNPDLPSIMAFYLLKITEIKALQVTFLRLNENESWQRNVLGITSK